MLLPVLLAVTVKAHPLSVWLERFDPPPGLLFHSFIVFSVAVYLLETYLDYRQHGKYGIAVRPQELSWVTDADFLLAQQYGLDKSRFAFVLSAFNTAKLLLMLLTGVYPLLWQLSGDALLNLGVSPAIGREIPRSCVFFVLEQLLDTGCSLPFNLYKTFVLEQQHGFNKQTPELFFSDLLKQLSLTFVIGLPLLSLLLFVIDSTGPHFYLYVWLVVLAVQLLAITLYPLLIQPLFNKVEPLEDGPLRSAVESLAARCGFPLTRLYRMDGSRRSSHSNAYQYGCCGHKRIVIYDTLITQAGQQEVVAILGHEIGHWQLSHTVKQLLLAQLQILSLFSLFALCIRHPRLYSDFGFSHTRAAYVGLTIFQWLYSPLQQLLSFAMNAVSRRFEYAADAFAVSLGYGDELSRGLAVLHRENKGTMINDPLWSAYHHSHPPVLDRLTAIALRKKQ